MICPFRIKGAKADWIARHPEDFECLKLCAWLVQDVPTNTFSCAMAQLASEGNGVPYVTLAEQFPLTDKTTS